MNMNDIFPGYYEIRQSLAMTEPCIDVSECRSPGRALRRWRKYGIRGHIKFERPSKKVVIIEDHILVCHPQVYYELIQRVRPKYDIKVPLDCPVD